MTEHSFKKTTRTRFVGGKLLTISRCERCDSEVAFDAKLTDGDVNRAVMIRWPKFACVSKLLSN